MLSSLIQQGTPFLRPEVDFHAFAPEIILVGTIVVVLLADLFTPEGGRAILPSLAGIGLLASLVPILTLRSEEHTSELQSLMRISYAVFCLKKKNTSYVIQQQ